MAKGEHPAVQVVTLETVDQAVRDWLDLTVDAHVAHPDGSLKKVPVNFSAGERFVTGRQVKGIRDKNGVLILPIVSVRRTGIDPQPGMQALGTETPRLYFSKRISGKTNNLMNLNVSRSPSQRMPNPIVYEVTSIPFPDRSVLQYELVIQAQYTTQMNAILEKMFHELDLQKSFVAPFENDGRHPPIGVPNELRRPLSRGYVVGFFDANMSDSGNLDEFTDQERIIRYTTTFTVPTTLQLDPDGEEPSVKTERTAFGLDFGDERTHFVDDPLELELVFGPDGVRER